VVTLPHMTPLRHSRRSFAALAALLAGGVAFAACGGGSGPSVASPGSRAGQAVTSTTTTTIPASTTTSVPATVAPTVTPTTAVPAGQQLVTYSGLQFEVPSSWPVYQMSSDPNRCVRFDQSATYLGAEGPAPLCPATLVGRTEAVQIEPLNPQSSTAQLATAPQTLNGLSVRVDPKSASNYADTVAFPDLGLVAIITIGSHPALAAQILQSFQRAS
jgi:hypothetical protein